MTASFLNALKSRWATIATLILCLGLYWISFNSTWVQKLEWQLQDYFITQRAELNTPDKNIIIIDIDDNSLLALGPILGKWPWPRAVHAELLEYLNPHQPAAIIFDILFPEKDYFRPDADAYFSEVAQQSHNIFFAAATQQTSLSLNTPLLMSYQKKAGLIRTNQAQESAKGLLLLPHFANHNGSTQSGSIDLIPDQDGLIRRYHVRQDLEGWQLLSLPAKVAQHLGKTLPPQDTILMDWTQNKTIPHQRLSFAEILSQARGENQVLPAQYLKDKVIIIGTTALGLHDLRATPISNFFPGVYLLSTALDNLLNQNFLSLWPQSKLSPWVLLSLSLIAACYTIQLTWLASMLAGLGFLTLIILSWQSALGGQIVTIMPALIALTVLVIGSLLITYHKHQQKLRKTIQIFSRFMDPGFVKALLDKNTPEELLTTKNVEVTMLFSDIRNFTSISETRTAGEMVNLLNHYFDRQVDTLFKHKATLDKFIGDAVMAFWGAPLEHDKHPVYAINAALDMIDNLNEFIKEYGYQDFDIGIGIHTGYAVVGLIGSHERYDYTAIGDTVNLASRIEGLTKGRARILVSETTRDIAQDHFDFVPQGEFQVKGRAKPVKLYEPLRKMEDAS